MKRIVKSIPARKAYESPLREANTAHTRERILDALVTVLAAGPAELSVPAVAREAGVSVPTVYRHFGSKRGLMQALYDGYTERIGAGWPPGQMSSVEAVLEHMPDIFRRQDELDDGMRAAMSTDVANEMRRKMMPDRLAGMEQALRADGIRGPDLARLVDVLTIFTSSPVRQAFKDFFGYDVVETTERVAWAVRTLVEAVKHEQPKRKRKR